MLYIYMFSALAILTARLTEKSGPPFSAISLDAIPILLGLGILPTALAHTLYFSSLSGLKPFETATLALLEPIAATSVGVLIFAEIPNALIVIGAVLVLAGMISVAIHK